jgi:hypothetical protein
MDKSHWRNIDRFVLSAKDQMAFSPALSNAFELKYKGDKEFARCIRARVNIALNTKPENADEENIMREIIYNEISGFRTEFERLMKYGKYTQYSQEYGFEPLKEEEFFKVEHPPRTGTSHLPPKYRRHASPATRSGVLSRRERNYRECSSVSINWDHIFREQLEPGCRIHNPYSHFLEEFYAREKYAAKRAEWEKTHLKRTGRLRYPERKFPDFKPPRKKIRTLQAITPEGYLTYYKVKFVKDETGKERKVFELYQDHETIEFDRVIGEQSQKNRT